MHTFPGSGAAWSVRLLVACLLVAATVRPASGQGLLPGVAGAGAGLVVGGAVGAGFLTARAHFADDYLDGYHDLVPLPAALVTAGVVSGIVLGSTDSRALGRASLGALLVGAAGTGIGILAGRQFLDPETGPWAGAILGGAGGALTGWILGALLGGGADAPRTGFSVRLPLPGGSP